MSEKVNFNKEGATNVKTGQVIDFTTIDTKGRKDDEAWNSMKFYGESDEQELEYRSPEKVNREAMAKINRIKAQKIGLGVLGAFKMA